MVTANFHHSSCIFPWPLCLFFSFLFYLKELIHMTKMLNFWPEHVFPISPFLNGREKKMKEKQITLNLRPVTDYWQASLSLSFLDHFLSSHLQQGQHLPKLLMGILISLHFNLYLIRQRLHSLPLQKERWTVSLKKFLNQIHNL